jgi:hypothetical protein
MEIRLGKYATKYSESDETWNTYYKNILIAATPKDLWEDEDIEFDSRQAGEALLYTTIELTGAISEVLDGEHEPFDKPVHDEFPDLKHQEHNMEKTDDGDVKDIESPSDKIQDNNLDIEPEEQAIIQNITELLEKLFEMKHQDTDEPDDELHDISMKIDAAIKEYTMFQGLKLERKLYKLSNKVRQALNNNLDCTAELEEAEKIIKALRNL